MKQFKLCPIVILICFAFTCWGQNNNNYILGKLDDAWKKPSEDSKPWTFWYWMHNNVSKEGIKADLEAMADHGIGGAYLFSIGGGQALTNPPVPSLTDLWWQHVDYTVEQANRLGLKIRLNACDGWATAAGPEITPELSMQELTWSKTIIPGGELFQGQIEKPKCKENYYRDIALLAYPEPVENAASSLEQQVKVTSSFETMDFKELLKGDGKGIELPQPGWFQYEFDTPITCRSITIVPSRRSYQAMRLEVQISDDGENFSSLGHLPVPRHGWQDIMVTTSAIEPTKAKFFRFVYDPAGSEKSCEDLDHAKEPGVGLTQVIVSEQPVISDWQGKAGFSWRISKPTTNKQLPDCLAVDADKIIDLTDQLNNDGSLCWKAPPGNNWVIQRIGYTTTGMTNGPAGAGIGLEADKFNPAAVDAQVASWFGKAAARYKKLMTKVLAGSHTDSWECACQNWSPVFRNEFIKRRGYDPIRYLPAMTGVPIANAEISERFLHDVRQTIAEIVPDNFFAPMVKKVHKLGGNFSAECIAPTMLSDGMSLYGQVDIPMGEFWYESFSHDKPTDILDAVYGGRLYGKRIIQAEAFTQINMDWDDDPFAMKTLGDHNFALGINRFVLHVWALNALNQSPGITLDGVGSEYSRMQTWWRASKVWFDYLQRCQAVLQLGVPVADVLYYVGENQPTRALLHDRLNPQLPDGYTYGCINRDALLNYTKAKNGKIMLPGKMTYSMLILPDNQPMTPEVAQKIAELAQANVPVIGQKPTRSPSMTNYPKCDQQLRDIVASGWDKVNSNCSLPAVLEKLNILPDLTFKGVDQSYVWHEKQQYTSRAFSWGHRQDGRSDIYFISNQQYQPRNVEAVFRVNGKQPELWNPDTGQQRQLANWWIENGLTHIPLEFAPAESYFIVFRKASAPPKLKAANFPEFDVLQDIQGPWKVQFQLPNGSNPPEIVLSELQSLHKHPDEQIKHFSGTAVYRNTFEFQPNEKQQDIFIDLGNVANLAEVTLNGQSLGFLWKPPFRINITKAIKPGTNTLEIAVSTTWHNRMVADAELNNDSRISSAPMFPLSRMRDRQLIESGLIGPVKILTEKHN